MAKKAKVTIRKPPAMRSELELRRWCIEQAIRWPMDVIGGGNGGAYGIPGHIGQKVEQDVIGRAKRLREWVTATA